MTDEWVIVSPHRAARPWSGATDGSKTSIPASYDPECYLCPGNARANGDQNDDYQTTFVFDNDFAALGSAVPTPTTPASDLFQVDAAAGECRVVCFSPDHGLSLAEMDPHSLEHVIELFCEQARELEQRHRWVQIFETRGAVCGASNAHPHGQIWASSFLPDEPAKERRAQMQYKHQHGSHLLLDYVEQELASGERIVDVNSSWVILVPYWAYWPFETIVVPRRRVPSLSDVTATERSDVAHILQGLLAAYDRVFDTPFPYCSGWHSGGQQDREFWQLHAHYYPPLLRSASVAKIPASYEVLAGVQRDITPEDAADRLRSALSSVRT